MPPPPKKHDSPEAGFVEAFVHNLELRAKREERTHQTQQEILARISNVEMAMMRDAVAVDDNHSGATERLEVLTLRLAQLTRAVNDAELAAAKREGSLIQMAANLLTIQRDVKQLRRRQQPWYEWLWERWQERKEQ